MPLKCIRSGKVLRTRVTLEHCLGLSLDATALLMSLHMFRPAEVFEAWGALEHCLDQVADTTTLLVSLQVLRSSEVLGAWVTLEHCIDRVIDITSLWMPLQVCPTGELLVTLLTFNGAGLLGVEVCVLHLWRNMSVRQCVSERSILTDLIHAAAYSFSQPIDKYTQGTTPFCVLFAAFQRSDGCLCR